MDTATFTMLIMAGVNGVIPFLVIREHFYVEIEKTWLDAQEYCKNRFTDLSSLLTEDDMNRVLDVTKNRTAVSTWIGLRITSQTGGWRWTPDKRRIDIGQTNWAVGQPKIYKYHYGKSCGYMYQGQWYNQKCYHKFPFVCFKEYHRIMTLVQESMTWEESLDYCRHNYTDLASLASEYTAEQLVLDNMGIQTDFVWTGLRFLAGQWLWVNRDALEFEGWVDADSYQCGVISQRCGALSVTDTFWEAKPCEEKLNFICYMQLPIP